MRRSRPSGGGSTRPTTGAPSRPSLLRWKPPVRPMNRART